MFQHLQPAIQGLILDMDGVLWRGMEPIGDLPAIFARIKELGLRVVMATNNATLSPRLYMEKLAGFGVQVERWQIISSGQSLAYQMSKQYPQGGPVYVIGEAGLRESLAEYHFFESDGRDPLAVIVGLDRGINYEKLRQATLLIRKGVPFFGTNPDKTYPSPEGLIPGAGTIIAAVEAATDQKPLIAGKPERPMFDLALDRLGTTPAQTLMVGDRFDTDIIGAQSLGIRTALVLTGISTREEAENENPGPDIIAPDLSSLLNVGL